MTEKQIFDYEKNLHKTPEPYRMDVVDLTTLRLKYCIESFPPRKNLKILEVGCGQGAFMATIAVNLKEFKGFGIDISKNAIKNAKKSHQKIVYLVSDAQNIPFKDKYFDVIIVIDVLEHLDDVRGTLKEIKRILKNDGVFHCHVPCEGGVLTWTWLANKTHIGNKLKFKYAGHIQQFKKNEIVNLIAEQFTVKKVNYSFHLLGQLSDLYIYILKHFEAMPKGKSKLVPFFIKNSRNLIKIIRRIAYHESLLLKNRSIFALALHIDAETKNKH